MMKKLNILLLISLSSAMLLLGCGKDKTDSDPVETTGGITLDNEVTDNDETVAAETEVSHEGMVRSDLTNEWIDEAIADNRPIAFMFPHDKVAMPQSGIADADVLYECYAQASEPRMMGIIKDWQNLEKIGNVRSCRDYYVYWALEWDAIYCHAGLAYYAADILSRDDVDHLDSVGCAGALSANASNGTFYRTNDRKAPHNLFTSGELLKADFEKHDFSLTYRDQYYHADHFTFAEDETPNTLDSVKGVFDATYLDMSPAFGVDKPTFEYNEKDGLYYKNIYGNPHVDDKGTQLAFANVVVQNTRAEARDPHKYWYYEVHDNTRDGYYFTQGKGIHVTWEKGENYEPTKYYDDDGNEVVFNTGKTMIFITQDGQTVDYK